MKHTHFFEQDDSDTTAFSLADFGAQFYEQALNISPLDVATRRAGKNKFKGASVLPLHTAIVPLSGTNPVQSAAIIFRPLSCCRRTKILAESLSD